MKKRYIYAIIFVAAILLCFGLVDAYRGNIDDWKHSGEGHQKMYKKCGEMNHEECPNYKAHWMNSLDEDSKEKFEEIKEAIEAEDFEKVKELKTELGLNFGHMGKRFHGDCPFKK